MLANGSLHFTSVQHTRNERPDEGLYQCSATRPSVGTIISRAAKLQIASLPRFELEPKDVAVRVGDTARFNCLVMVNDFFLLSRDQLGKHLFLSMHELAGYLKNKIKRKKVMMTRPDAFTE